MPRLFHPLLVSGTKAPLPDAGRPQESRHRKQHACLLLAGLLP